MNLFKAGTTFVLLLLFMTSGFAQPEMTLWRIQADDGHDHESTEQHDAELYSCGDFYYVVDQGDNTIFNFSIKNEGDEDLVLELPLRFMNGSDAEYVVTQPQLSTLSPGAEALFQVTYVSPETYRDDIAATIVIESNAWTNPVCGFNFETGTDSYYCSCKDGVIDSRMNPNPVGFPVPQDELLIRSGMCQPGDVCPAVSEIGCYGFDNLWSGNQFIQLRTLTTEDDLMICCGARIFIQDGYCPCDIPSEELPDVCIDSPFGNEFVRSQNSGRNDISSRMENLCPGDAFVVDTSLFCLAIGALGSDIGESDAPPEEPIEFSWAIDGFGTATPAASGDSAVITGWEYGDVIILKIMKGECMEVKTVTIRNNLLSFSSITQGENGNSCINTFKFCYSASRRPFLKERERIGTRGEDITWSTDGDGSFSESWIEEDGKLGEKCCVTVTGLVDGDRILAETNALGPDGCAVSNYRIYNGDDRFCNARANENFIFTTQARLDDPCNCSDPLNYTSGGVTYFHDVLTLEDLVEGEQVSIYNFSDWYQNGPNEGVLQVSDIDRIAPASGIVLVDFWHIEDEQSTAIITSDMGSFDIDGEAFSSSVCSACLAIPTLGQWGIMCLGLLTLTFGLVAIRNRKPQLT